MDNNSIAISLIIQCKPLSSHVDPGIMHVLIVRGLLSDALDYYSEKDMLPYFFNINPKYVNIKGETAMHTATSKKKKLIMEYLASTYPSLIEIPDNDGWYPIHYSASRGSASEMLVWKDLMIDPDIQTKEGLSPFQILIRDGEDSNILKYLNHGNPWLGSGTKNNWTCLHIACRYSSYAVVEALLALGMDPRITTEEGIDCRELSSVYGSVDTFLLINSASLII